MIHGIVDILSDNGYNVYSMVAPQEVSFPYVVVTLDGVEPTQTKSSGTLIDYVSVSVILKIVGNHDTADAIANSIRVLLDRNTTTSGGYTTDSISFQNRFDEAIFPDGYEHYFSITQEFRARIEH